MSSVAFKLYDTQYDNVLPDRGEVEVDDVLVLAILRVVLGAPAGWRPGGREAEDVLGRLLIALSLLSDDLTDPNVAATHAALGALADLASDALAERLVVAWA